MNGAPHLSLELEQLDGYEFRVRFDTPQAGDLFLDESPPLGKARGPNPARLVAAAVAHCLSSSLMFCLGRLRETPGRLHTRVTGELVRNERGRLRLGRFDVTIQLPGAAREIEHLELCTRRFEDFCIVTESVRHGIDVGVRVIDHAGHEVWAAGGKVAQQQPAGE